MVAFYLESRGIVQLVEYRSPKPQVEGSNPSAPAIKKVKNMKKLLNYFRSVIKELKLVVFPTKQDVYMTSVNIVIILIVSMLLMSFADFLISKLIKLLLGVA